MCMSLNRQLSGGERMGTCTLVLRLNRMSGDASSQAEKLSVLVTWATGRVDPFSKSGVLNHFADLIAKGSGGDLSAVGFASRQGLRKVQGLLRIDFGRHRRS